MSWLNWLGVALVIGLLAGLIAGGVLLSNNLNSATGYEDYSIKMADDEEDVQSILSLAIRKEIYLRDWQEAERIDEYTTVHYPVDFAASNEVQRHQMLENDEAWNRMYKEFIANIRKEYGITEWQFFQILDEGMENMWQAEL